MGFQALGQLDSAIKDYRGFIKLDSNQIEALFNLGTAFQTQGKFNEAIDCFSNILNKDPLSINLKYEGSSVWKDGEIAGGVITLNFNEIIYQRVNSYVKIGGFKSSATDYLNCI